MSDTYEERPAHKLNQYEHQAGVLDTNNRALSPYPQASSATPQIHRAREHIVQQAETPRTQDDQAEHGDVNATIEALNAALKRSNTQLSELQTFHLKVLAELNAKHSGEASAHNLELHHNKHTISELKENISKLESKTKKVQEQRDTWSKSYTLLSEKYGDLEDAHNKLMNAHGACSSGRATLQSRITDPKKVDLELTNQSNHFRAGLQGSRTELEESLRLQRVRNIELEKNLRLERAKTSELEEKLSLGCGKTIELEENVRHERATKFKKAAYDARAALDDAIKLIQQLQARLSRYQATEVQMQAVHDQASTLCEAWSVMDLSLLQAELRKPDIEFTEVGVNMFYAFNNLTDYDYRAPDS
ncbi:hypothetical protein NX059_009778 [Plenodomus lindquistii]|nr:hypothetical protein NX059_009778 [Plenodomus lindquistii]